MKKKWIIALLSLAALASLGFFVVKAHDYYTSGDYQYYGYYMPGMRGGYCYDEEQPSYEYLYSHLSTEDQAVIDQMYADQLAQYDFSTMTDDEKVQAIDTVKADLSQYIIDNHMVPYWG